jgi:DNA-binding transcriptional MerR regulator
MIQKESLLKIGELAKRAKVTPRTVRFYIQEGLLPQPKRVHKNLALYDPKSVEMITAIKKAQNKRFLPLVMIRQILEQNDFDYSSLDMVEVPAVSNNDSPLNRNRSLPDLKEPQIPEKILKSLRRKKIIQKADNDQKVSPSAGDSQMLNLLSVFHENGLEWDDLLPALVSIRKKVEDIAEYEFQALIGGLIKNPRCDFQAMLRLEDSTLQNFINKTRYNSLKNIISRYQSNLDYSLFSSADEGFHLQAPEIKKELEDLKQQLQPGSQDKRLLNDLALGHSCHGNQELSLRYLRRIRKFAPDDPETNVRWIWYRRFTQRPQDQNRLKKQLEKLVASNPEFSTGRAFMAVWYAFDIQEAEAAYEILRLTNLCLREIEAADKCLTDDLHDWTLIQYIKGRLSEWLQMVPGYIESGIADFEKILFRKSELDLYYAEHKPFFSKWLWPNIYLFLGTLYNQVGRFEEAMELMKKGRGFRLQAPYSERLETEIRKAESGIADR